MKKFNLLIILSWHLRDLLGIEASYYLTWGKLTWHRGNCGDGESREGDEGGHGGREESERIHFSKNLRFNHFNSRYQNTTCFI